MANQDEAHEVKQNSLGELNVLLFEELRRLSDVDATDAAAIEAEVARSKAVSGIAKTVIENANTVLEATRMRATYTTAQPRVPRMLEG